MKKFGFLLILSFPLILMANDLDVAYFEQFLYSFEQDTVDPDFPWGQPLIVIWPILRTP